MGVFLAACVLAATSAWAEPAPQPVAVWLSPCLDVPFEEVRRVLAVELGDRLVDADGRDPGGAAAVYVSCEPTVATVRLTRARCSEREPRRVELRSDEARVRARAVAVAVVETVAACDEGAHREPTEPEAAVEVPAGVPPPWDLSDAMAPAEPRAAAPDPWDLSDPASAAGLGSTVPAPWDLSDARPPSAEVPSPWGDPEPPAAVEPEAGVPEPWDAPDEPPAVERRRAPPEPWRLPAEETSRDT